MRCLSPHSNYSIQVFEGQEQIMMDARGFSQTITVKKPVVANFETSGLTEYELEAALMSFNFSGIPDGVNPLTRVAVFDTDLYIEQQLAADEELDKEFLNELRERMENRLRKLQARHPSEFIIVDPPAHEIPWPTYDEDSVEEILAARERFRFSPQAIRLYELENKGRTEIIEHMTALEEAAADEGGDRILVTAS
jgi:hypothetical protein